MVEMNDCSIAYVLWRGIMSWYVKLES